MKKATGVNREVEGGIRQGQSTRERKVNISERVAVTIYGNEYTRRSRAPHGDGGSIVLASQGCSRGWFEIEFIARASSILIDRATRDAGVADPIVALHRERATEFVSRHETLAFQVKG